MEVRDDSLCSCGFWAAKSIDSPVVDSKSVDDGLVERYSSFDIMPCGQ